MVKGESQGKDWSMRGGRCSADQQMNSYPYATPKTKKTQTHRLEENGTFTALATHYQGQRLNSPNDLVYGPGGDLYFTDPPYGLNGKEEDPSRYVCGIFGHACILGFEKGPRLMLIFGFLDHRAHKRTGNSRLVVSIVFQPNP